MAETKTAGNDNLMGAVAYLLGFITGVVLLLVEKKSKFVRFHAMQSTIAFGGLFILGIVVNVVPVLGQVVSALLGVVQLILWLVMMFKAYQGEMYKLPYVGDLAEEQLKKFQ